MVVVISKRRGLQHGGTRALGERFEVGPREASELERKGLVEVVRDPADSPPPPAGATSSASPAGQVSPPPIAKPSGSGARKRKRAKSRPVDAE